MKRESTICVVLSVLVLFASCGKSSGKVETSAGTKTPATLTFYHTGGTPDLAWDDPVAKKITELTGVSLDITTPVGQDTQAIALMLASGKYPDIIFAAEYLGMFIEAGAVIPLDDLIESRGDNLKKLYGDQLSRMRNSAQDPRIYQVGTFGVNEPKWTVDGTVQIQHAVLKELGYPKINTLADYEKALKEYIAKYPTINGQKTIALSLYVGNGGAWHAGLGNQGNFLIGYPDDGEWIVDQNTLEATYKYFNPDMQLWFRWLNRMYAEGILDPESFTQNENTWKAKITSGRLLGISYPKWGYFYDTRPSLVSDGLEERTFVDLSVTADERFIDPSMKIYSGGGSWGIAISSAAKDPERAFEFLDWMASEEAQKLLNWGLEGVNYIVVDGKRVVPPEQQLLRDSDPDYSKKTGVGRYAYPFPIWGKGAMDSTGNYITMESPETIKANYLPVEKETLAAYGAEMWTDLFPPSEVLGVSRHGQAWQYTLPPDLNAKFVEADNFVKTALANIVIGNPDNFDTAWENMVQACRRIGMEEVGRAMTQLIQERAQLTEMKN